MRIQTLAMKQILVEKEQIPIRDVQMYLHDEKKRQLQLMRKVVIRIKCYNPKNFHKAKYFDKLKSNYILRKNMKEGLRRALAMI